MRLPFVSIPIAGKALPHGSATIAVGLAILTAAMLWPVVPGLTAMALVALGATGVTLARFRGTAAILPIMLAHITMYGGLYALFVGATLHSAATRPGTGLSFLVIADLAASIVPLAIALERVWCELRADRLAE